MTEENKNNVVEENEAETEVVDVVAETEASSADVAQEEPKEAEPKDELTLLKEANKELEEKMLRTLAEHENFRKAMFKEGEKKVSVAIKNMVTKFLSVMGAFSQGIKAAETSNDISGVLSGMKMVEVMFNNALTDIGVKEVEAKEGIPFDPNFHQPISRQESADYPENSVLTVVAKGYVLNGLLVQPAMVVVSCAPAKKSEDSKDSKPVEDTATKE